MKKLAGFLNMNDHITFCGRIGDEELLKTMGEKSLESSREYDINLSVGKLLDLYYSLL